MDDMSKNNDLYHPGLWVGRVDQKVAIMPVFLETKQERLIRKHCIRFLLLFLSF